ncbi:tetraspanin-18-like isoform X1 [Dreissena polymorpha]|nr:tetraspanin-18-like isoform X1 [Dreissena polymorpha]XP_052232645.1 tetraspanin-18-like isoform X1 [Dreissena polymorpha]
MLIHKSAIAATNAVAINGHLNFIFSSCWSNDKCCKKISDSCGKACSGACINKCALILSIWPYTHVVIITTSVIIQIVCAIVMVFYTCRIEYHMNERLKWTLDYSEFKPHWDTVQVEKVCCGVHGPDDYINTTTYNASGKYVPETCCVSTNDQEIDHPQAKNETLCQEQAKQLQTDSTLITTFVKSEGCYDPILKDFRSYIKTLYMVAFVSGGVEGFSLLILCCVIACI